MRLQAVIFAVAISVIAGTFYSAISADLGRRVETALKNAVPQIDVIQAQRR